MSSQQKRLFFFFLKGLVMNSKLITKISQAIQRDNGSQIKIAATEMYGSGLEKSIDFFVLQRNNKSENWRLLGNQPRLNYKNVSLDTYIKKGRAEYLDYVSHGEALKVISYIGKPLSCL